MLNQLTKLFLFLLSLNSGLFAQESLQNVLDLSNSILPDSYKTVNALDHYLNNYKVSNLDIKFDDMNFNKSSQLNLIVADQKLSCFVEPNKMNLDNKKLTNIHLLGGKTETGQNLSLTIADDFIYGTINEGKSELIIQPLYYFDPSAPRDAYVSYYTKDIKKGLEEFACAKGPEGQIQKQLNKSSQDCGVVNIAIANTYDMVEKYGSEQAVLNHNVAVLNSIRNNYRFEFDKNIEFNLIATYMSEGVQDEPMASTYIGSDGMSMLLRFAEWAGTKTDGSAPIGTQGGFSKDFDMALLWTARDLSLSGKDIVGLAYRPGWFTLLQDYTPLAPKLKILMSHEVAHNMGADHDASDAQTIMAPNMSEFNIWSNQSTSGINTFLTDFIFTTSCDILGEPIARIEQSHYVSCIGQPILLHDKSINGSISNWQVEGNETFKSKEAKYELSFDTPGEKEISLTSENGSGTSQASSSIKIIDEPTQIQCQPEYLATEGGISMLTLGEYVHFSDLTEQSTPYEDFKCSNIMTFEPGRTYDMNITVSGIKYLSFFLDKNGDGEFDTSSEKLGEYLVHADGTYYLPLSLPQDVVVNELLTLRVITNDLNVPIACIVPEVGQVEDHSIYFKSSALTWYEDKDEDGFGNPDKFIVANDKPEGYVSRSGDCNDWDATIHPDAPDPCDGIDNNCNFQIDDNNCLKVTQYIWDDANANSIMDSDELGLAGVRVNLVSKVDQSIIMQTSTDFTGSYTFDNLSAGDYYLEFDYKYVNEKYLVNNQLVPAYTDEKLVAFDISLPMDMNGLPDICFYEEAKINGHSYFENTLEPSKGTKVQLYKMNNEFEVVAEVLTDEIGYYHFDKLSPGEYYLEFQVSPDYFFLINNAIDNNITVTTSHTYYNSGETNILSLMPGDYSHDINALLGNSSSAVLDINESFTLNAEYISEKQEVLLNWNIIQIEAVEEYRLYKTNHIEGEWSELESFTSSEFENSNFVDYEANSGYNYYKIIGYSFGQEIVASEIQAINIIQNVDINVFPNPSTEYVKINGFDSREGILEMYDLSGNKLQINKTESSENETTIDLTDFPSGMYSLKIENQENIIVKQLIIAH